MRRQLGNMPAYALLLGVTTELTVLADKILAVDHNEEMIAERWRNVPPFHQVMFGEWLKLSQYAPKATFDAVIGDGSLNMLDFPTAYQTLFRELTELVRPKGVAVIRLFAAPEQAETCDAVQDRTWAGQIGSFHAFKWQWAHAVMAQSHDTNIAVENIRATFNSCFPDRDALAAKTGWGRETIDTIDVYAGKPTLYSFPTLSQFGTCLPGDWMLENVSHGSYEMAERCPIVTLRRDA